VETLKILSAKVDSIGTMKLRIKTRFNGSSS